MAVKVTMVLGLMVAATQVVSAHAVPILFWSGLTVAFFAALEMLEASER
jgi:hypothetical protein